MKLTKKALMAEKVRKIWDMLEDANSDEDRNHAIDFLESSQCDDLDIEEWDNMLRYICFKEYDMSETLQYC